MRQTKATLPEAVNEGKTAQWNKCITPRLESLRGWFTQEAWTDGLLPYLMSCLLERREHLEKQDNEHTDDQFIKGQIAMLKQVCSIPSVIEKQIEQIEANRNSGPKGDAGY